MKSIFLKGIIVKYDEKKGFGFIRTKELNEDVFVHIRSVVNAKTLFVSQEVKFEVKNTPKGLSAFSVKAGRKQTSPFIFFGTISLLITIAITLLLVQKIHILGAYLIAVNITTIMIYGYDKLISSTSKLRVPEKNLHTLAILGGSLSALMSQNFFRHKTLKKSFQITYWIIVVSQIVAIWFVFMYEA